MAGGDNTGTAELGYEVYYFSIVTGHWQTLPDLAHPHRQASCGIVNTPLGQEFVIAGGCSFDILAQTQQKIIPSYDV